MSCAFPACGCASLCWIGEKLATLPRAIVQVRIEPRGRRMEPERPAPSRPLLEEFIGKPCPYCGRPMYHDLDGRWGAPTRDHVLPRSRGGTFLDSRNRLIVCRRCNEHKADMTIIEFAGWLVANGDSRAERVKRLAVELAMEGDEVLAGEECRELA